MGVIDINKLNTYDEVKNALNYFAYHAPDLQTPN